ISWLDGDALYYLGNSPLVLFTALLSIGLAIRALSRSLGVTAWALSGAMAGVCLLGLFTFALSLQRASLAAVCAYTALCLLIATVGCPRRMAFVWLLSGVAAAFWFDDLAAAFSPVFDRLAAKTHLVGANMRIQEWQAVWAQICQSPLTFLFGQGWGGGFSSPAVADIRVNYTHSLFSALLLKTGVVGMALGGVYMIAMLDVIRRLFGRNAFLALALAAPLMIDILFYAAYKSLDFGVLLTLISAAFVCYGNVVRPCGKVYDMDYSTSASVQQGSRHGSQPHSRPFTV
ncbi:MAG: O-antigen ligase family protein, partial [Bdellovibrionales bacterium]